MRRMGKRCKSLGKRLTAAALTAALVIQGITVTSFGFGEPGENLLENGSFEETEQAGSGNLVKFWKDGIYPAGWNGLWDASSNSQGKILLEVTEEETYDGDNSVYVKALDSSARLEFYTSHRNFDPSRDYLCSVMVKASEVSGTGFYMRVAANKTGTGTMNTYFTPGQKKVTGTTEDWVKFTVPITDLPQGADSLQLDLFIEKMTGELWLDDVRLEQTYRFWLEESDIQMEEGESRQLTPVFDEEDPAADIQWSSSNESAVTVDENGTVTAVGSGNAVIKSYIDEYHEAKCMITVMDSTVSEQYEDIRDKWRERLTGNQVERDGDPVWEAASGHIDEKAGENLSSMLRSGGGTDDRTTLWPDLDLEVEYRASSDGTLTAPFGTAFTRIEEMALAYASVESEYYRSEEMKDAVIDALTWMHENVYNENYDVKRKLYGNWWHWQIGIPQSLANTVILMYEDLPRDLIEKESATLEAFNEDPTYVYKVQGWGKMEMTSANLMDTSLVAVLRGIIAENSVPIAMAQQAFSQVLPYVTQGDGFYIDGSCIQHTNLAYTGGYGSTLLNGMNKIIYLVEDSSWAIADPQLVNVYRWILDGYRPLFAYGGIMDMVSGRAVARPSRSDQTAGRGILIPVVHLYQTAPDDMKEAIGSFAKSQIRYGLRYNPEYLDDLSIADVAAFKALLNNPSIPEEDGDKEYHKIFGAMDKVVHHTESFTLGISMYSGRTGSFEYGNGENLKGWHMSDGALYLYNGDQSQFAADYWPTVDPMRLPGITTDHSEGTVSESWNAHTSSKTWVGGSSVLSKYGSTGMEFEVENSTLTGKKSWFSFDEEVVALGAGIRSGSTRPVETIVENRKLREDGSNRILLNGAEWEGTEGAAETKEQVDWAWLEENETGSATGYYFPEGTTLQVQKEERVGSWRDINSTVKADAEAAQPIHKKYASLSIPHGTDPSGAAYSYVLLPGKTAQETGEYSENPGIRILSNTEDLQAVRKASLGVTGMNFWNPGVLEGVEALTPASLTMFKEGRELTMGISDPTQSGDTVKIILDGSYRVVSGDSNLRVANRSGRTEITVDTRGDLGKTHELRLLLNNMEEFDLLYERIYKQSIGFLPGGGLPENNSYIDGFVSALSEEAKGYWEIMNRSSDPDRVEIFQGIKPTLAGGPNSNSAEVTTTYKYLNKLVQSYYTEGTALYQKEGLLEEVLSAVDFTLEQGWYGKDTPKNTGAIYYGNWWDHRIGVPAQFLPLLTLMREEACLTPERYATYMEAMKYQKAHDWTGYNSANLADIGLNAMYIGILERDEELLTALKARFGSEMFGYTGSKNGWHPDGSYVDHEKFAYTGGYGSVLIAAMSRILPVLSGTGYEMTFGDERDDFYKEIIFNGYLPLHAVGTLTDSVRGRGITRQTAQRSNSTGHLAVFAGALPESEGMELKRILKGWLTRDPEIMKYLTRQGELIACQEILSDSSIEAKNPEKGFHSYNYMNKAVQQGEDYMAVVSMHSNTIANYEYLNTEGKRLWNISDGALFLYNGDLDQYREDYWPTVDKHRLPGTTSMNNPARPASAGYGTFNPNTWVSSIGLGEAGVTGMQIKTLGNGARDGAFAKKSYFMFDNKIVAVGSDIKNLSQNLEYSIETVIENRKIADDLSNSFTVDGTAVGTDKSQALYPAAKWAHLEGTDSNDSIGYVFPETASVHGFKESRTGLWSDMNDLPGMRTSDEPVTRGYATMYIDHGTRPEAASYQYVILPGRTAQETFQYQQNPDIEVLDSSIKVHAARDKSQNITAANFWTSQEVSTSDGKLTASRFATVLLKEETDSFQLVVANPLHDATEKIVVTVNLPADGYLSKDDNITVISEGEKLVLEIDVKDAPKDRTFQARFHLKRDQEAVNEELLEELEREAEQILLITDADKLESLISKAERTDTDLWNGEQKEKLDGLLRRLSKLKEDIVSVSELVRQFTDITQVDSSNEGTVRRLLADYQALTDSQRRLIPSQSGMRIREVEALWDQFIWNEQQEQENNRILDLLEEEGKEIFLLTDEGKLDILMGKVQNLDLSSFQVYQLNRRSELWNQLNQLKSMIQKTGELVEQILAMDEVNSENAGTVRELLKEYEELTEAESGLIPLKTKEKIEAVRKKTEQYLLSLKGNLRGVMSSKKTVKEKAANAYPSGEGTPDNWRLEEKGWRYLNEDGSYAAGEWKKIKELWYFFDEGGYMAVGWKKLEQDHWYYFTESGYMAVGWVLDRGTWYYLRPDGVMTTEPAGYLGKTYYFDSSGGCINP